MQLMKHFFWLDRQQKKIKWNMLKSEQGKNQATH